MLKLIAPSCMKNIFIFVIPKKKNDVNKHNNENEISGLCAKQHAGKKKKHMRKKIKEN